MNTIRYKKSNYPTRDLLLKIDGNPMRVTIAPQYFCNALDLEEEEAQEIDDNIYFYVDDSKFWLDAATIAEKHLDESHKLLYDLEEGVLTEKQIELAKTIFDLEIERLGNFGTPVVEDFENNGWLEPYKKELWDKIAEIEFNITDEEYRALGREALFNSLTEYRPDYFNSVDCDLYLVAKIREKYPLPKIVKTKYKIWMQVERIDTYDDGKERRNDVDDAIVSVGYTNTEQEADELMNDVHQTYFTDSL